MSNSAFTPFSFQTPSSGTSGTGQGELNIVTNPSATTDLTGWTASVPANLSRDATGSPLDPVIPTGFNLVSTATSQTLTSGSLTVPASLRNRKLKLEFYYEQVSGSGFQLQVAKDSGFTQRFVLTTDASGVSAIPATAGTKGKYTTYFDTDATSPIYVRFVSTGTGTIKLTQIIVGPGIQPQGAVVGEWTSYNPTSNGLGTITAIQGLQQRVGSGANVNIRFTTGPSFTAAEARIGLPGTITGFTTSTVVGFWERNSSTTNTVKRGALIAVNGNSHLLFSRDDYTTGASPFTAANGTDIFVPSEVVILTTSIPIPIAEWAGSGTVQLAQNDVEYAASTTGTWDAPAAAVNTVMGPSGAPISGSLSAVSRVKIVRFSTPLQQGDKAVLEYQYASGGGWVEASQSNVAFVNGAGLAFGAYISAISGTDVSVNFYQYAIAGTQYNSTTGALNWATASTPLAWRVRKSSAGAAVGFGIVQPGVSSGLVSASGLPGNTTGNSIAAGYVGEKKTFTSRAVACTVAGSWYGNASSLATLTKGVWLVVVKGSWVGNNTASAITFGYATNGSNDATGIIEVEAAVNAQNASASSGPVYTSTYYYIASADTDIFGKAVSEDQAGLTVTVGGFAVRIA